MSYVSRSQVVFFLCRFIALAFSASWFGRKYDVGLCWFMVFEAFWYILKGCFVH